MKSMLAKGMLRYAGWVNKWHWPILITIIALGIALFWTVRPTISNNSELLWLSGSKEYEKLKEANLGESYIYQIRFNVQGLDAKKLIELKAIYDTLKKNGAYTELYTPFNVPYGKMRIYSEGSRLFTFVTLDEEAPQELESLFQAHRNLMYAYVESKNKFVNFYLVSKGPHAIAIEHCPFEYTVYEPFSHETSMTSWAIGVFLVILFMGMMRLLFRTWVAPLSAAAFLGMLAIYSLSLFKWLSWHQYEHLSIVVIGLLLGTGNFLYFYYKWHIGQRLMSSSKSLKYTIGRILIPQIVHTAVIVISLSVFVWISKSVILVSLVIYVAIVMVVSLVLLFLFVPALLGTCTVQHPSLFGAGFLHHLIHKLTQCYDAKFGIKVLLAASILGLVLLFSIKSTVHNETPKMISIGFKKAGMDEDLLKKMVQLEETLAKSKNVESVIGFSSYMREVYPQHDKGPYRYEDASISGTMLYLDMFDQADRLFNHDKAFLQVYLTETANLQEVIARVRALPFSDELLFFDAQSLVKLAKLDIYMIVGAMVLGLLSVIAVIIGFFAKSATTGIKVFGINALPVVVFLTLVWILHLPISTELFVALLLGIAITTDAELHQYYNEYANGKISIDDVMGERHEEFHLVASNLLIHTVMFFMLVGIAAFLGGTIALTSLYLATMIMLGTISDTYFISKCSCSKGN